MSSLERLKLAQLFKARGAEEMRWPPELACSFRGACTGTSRLNPFRLDLNFVAMGTAGDALDVQSASLKQEQMSCFASLITNPI